MIGGRCKGRFLASDGIGASTPCLECHGVLVPVAADIASVITPPIHEALSTGEYEAREAALLPDVVERDDRVLEIGAGIGIISTIVSRLGCERIIAVEANPHLIPFIRRVHELNGVRNAAVLNTVTIPGGSGTATFHLREDFWMSSLCPGPEPYVDTVEVAVSDLNGLLREERISLVICDVEGAEKFLFRDADLSGVDRVYLELHDHLIGVGGVAGVFGTMAMHGFGYDPRGSAGAVVLFRRLREDEPPRAYRGHGAPGASSAGTGPQR